ncbi:hypothetical protein [Sporosarcina sp. Marseille-Q4943]|uniref:TcaA NTF2-like domain-containing protein n=1 Tax=Sporosarcina sp. Marseille-Q4943 TaxID=2942204 RepID=UPI00208DBDAA|nr:hypothetical protein [Sporosarcina sp. Marseille-Q4943]
MVGKFCKECGSGIGEGLAFCPSCGTAVPASSVPATSEVPKRTKAPREPMKRKTKMLLAVVVAFCLLAVGTHFILSHLNDSTKQLKRIHNAIIDEDGEALFAEFFVRDDLIYVKDSFAKSLQTENLSVLFDELTHTVDRVKNSRLTEVVVDESGVDLFRVKYGKRFYVYPTALIEPIPHPLFIDTDLTDTTLVIADREFELTGKPLTIINVLPDSYTLTLRGNNTYVDTEESIFLDRSSFNTNAEIKLSRSAYAVQLEGMPSDSIVFVNGKSTEKTLAELPSIAPIFGEGATFHAIRSLDGGGTEESEKVVGIPGHSISFTFPLLVKEEQEAKEREEAARLEREEAARLEREETARKEREKAESDLALLQEAAETYQAFRSAYEDALNFRNFAYVEPYLNGGSNVYKEMKKFIADMDPDSFYVFSSNEVVDAEIIGDVIHLHVREKFYYTDKRETLEYDRKKRYEFEKNGSGSGLRILKIHIEDTKKNKS